MWRVGLVGAWLLCTVAAGCVRGSNACGGVSQGTAVDTIHERGHEAAVFTANRRPGVGAPWIQTGIRLLFCPDAEALG